MNSEKIATYALTILLLIALVLISYKLLPQLSLFSKEQSTEQVVVTDQSLPQQAKTPTNDIFDPIDSENEIETPVESIAEEEWASTGTDIDIKDENPGAITSNEQDIQPAGPGQESAADTEQSPVNLTELDGEMLDSLQTLVPKELVTSLITNEEIIRKFVATVDALANNQILQKHKFVTYRPRAFEPDSINNKIVLHSNSHQRYDWLVNIVTTIDVDFAAKLYTTHMTLFETAYSELGSGVSFLSRTEQAINNILTAPKETNPIELQKPTIYYYRFSDANYERLPTLHKQLLRMGPKNTEKLRAFTWRFKSALQDARLQAQP